MKKLVLDSWPILEWMSGRESASAYVSGILARAEQNDLRLFMSAINVGEVYYFLKKLKKEALAESWRQSASTLPVTIELPNHEEIWNAASLKGRFRISYADAFAAALAQKYNCPLVTGDPEFNLVTDLTLSWLDKS